MRQIIYVEWEDHCQYQNGWLNFDTEVDNKPCLIRSVGFLIHEDKLALTLASCNDTQGKENVGKGISTIIKSCIKKRRKIRL